MLFLFERLAKLFYFSGYGFLIDSAPLQGFGFPAEFSDRSGSPSRWD
jgi:hypothetical protein